MADKLFLETYNKDEYPLNEKTIEYLQSIGLDKPEIRDLIIPCLVLGKVFLISFSVTAESKRRKKSLKEKGTEGSTATFGTIMNMQTSINTHIFCYKEINDSGMPDFQEYQREWNTLKKAFGTISNQIEKDIERINNGESQKMFEKHQSMISTTQKSYNERMKKNTNLNSEEIVEILKEQVDDSNCKNDCFQKSIDHYKKILPEIKEMIEKYRDIRNPFLTHEVECPDDKKFWTEYNNLKRLLISHLVNIEKKTKYKTAQIVSEIFSREYGIEKSIQIFENIQSHPDRY